MKALVIGYGSIGQRHARVLNDLGLEVSVVSRRFQNGFCCYSHISEALQSEYFNYIVVANETMAHLETLKEIIANKFDGIILLEKPLFKNYEIIDNVPQNKTYVAYNLRFHPLIEKLKDLLTDEQVISVNAYVGQYLPTWRPDTDYSKGYSASSKQGGGVLRDLSHELDYLTMLFGDWQSLVAKSAKISALNIQSEDYVQVLYETKSNTQIILELNYLDRIIQRYLTIQTNQKTIKLDFINNTLICNGEVITLEKVDRDYTYRLQHESVLKGALKCCSFNEGLKIMKMIEAVENSSQLKEWVYND